MAVTSKSAAYIPARVTSKARSQNVRILDSRLLPLWLLHLCKLQRRFTVITWLLVTTLVTVYAGTAYYEQRWNQGNSRLETLQLHERQLMSTNAVVKNKLAVEAQEPDIKLVPPNPAETIILQPAPLRSPRATESMQLTTKLAARNSRLTRIPMGY